MEKYLNFIKSLINKQYLEKSEMYIKNNLSGYDSVMVKSGSNMYRNGIDNLFARIKTSGKIHYIAFRSDFSSRFEALGYSISTIKSDNEFFRITLNDFFDSEKAKANQSELSALMNDIFINTMSFSSFGCCDLYEKCSDEIRCLHDDQLYSCACMYRKNLESGHIFYGKNKNI